MLIGRKGVGKTAFSAKIRNLAKQDEFLYAEQISLTSFEFNAFAAIGKEENLEGTRKYKAAWELTLLIQLYRILYKEYNFSSVEEFNDVIEFLEQNHLLKCKNLNSTVRTLSKRSLEFCFKLFKVSADYNETNKISTSELNEKLIEVLSVIHFNGSKVRVIIDGLDDILRFTKDQLTILAGLIRAINEININLSQSNIPIKFILLAREDILAGITDPDFNKIKRDAGLIINWDARNDELKNLVNLRFKMSGVPSGNVKNHWNEIFPSKVRSKDSWNYILEFTLNKPRDILQFLTQCQKTFPNNETISFSDLEKVLNDYSNEYFLEEMKNELAGFFEDSTIIEIPQIMKSTGGYDFSYEDFKKIVAEYIGEKDDSYYRKLILTLFENGYVGQIEGNRVYDKFKKRYVTRTQAIFKHKKPTMKINYSNKFSLHKGFYKALGIVKK